MRTVLIGSDFMYDKDGNLKPIEINTAVGWHNNTIEETESLLDLTTLTTFITDNSFTKVIYIGNISNLDIELSGSCTTLGIEYEKQIVYTNAITIPFVEDNDQTLIIRSAYDTTALVDDTYCRDKVNFLNLIKDSSFGSQFAYLDENNSIVSNITTINDNGEHPNFILKARLPDYDKEVYPKFYKVSTQEELDTLISNVVTSDYFLMEFHLNQSELIQDHIKVFRGLNLLFPPNLESISLGGYTRACDDTITINSSFNPTTFELTTGREKYIAGNYQLVLPKLSDTDLVLMSDGTYKVATELVVGDVLKTIDIPNPFDVVDISAVANYRISQSELESGTTYSTNAITNIRRVNTYSKIVKITFTDGSDWFDNRHSNYLSIRNNEVRFLKLNGGDNDDAMVIGDNILLLDTLNFETPLFIIKEVSNIEMVSEFFGGYEITVENAHIFLTKSDVDSNKSYVSIEHNGVDCTYDYIGDCNYGSICGKNQLCCPLSPNDRQCLKLIQCNECAQK
jgi:hypothetical protein